VFEENESSSGIKLGLALIGGIFCIWLVLVLLSGFGLNATGIRWNFERTGQLGDSFGFLSALMATFAAMFAFQTLEKERAKTARLEHRERLQDDADKRREDEATFFKLLDFRNTIVNSISVMMYPSDKLESAEALEHIYDRVRRDITTALLRKNDVFDAYDDIYNLHKNDLGHYFRFTYHIIRFLDERFEEERAYEYVCLLRAQLSNSEQALVAMNCAYGEGAEKFKPLVEKYCFLHNLDEKDIINLDLDGYFEPTAFERDEERILETHTG
jgi:hypothetical protein